MSDKTRLPQLFRKRATARRGFVFGMGNASPLARKLGAFVALPDEELAVLTGLHQRRRTFVAGKDLVHQGQADQSAYFLADGWV